MKIVERRIEESSFTVQAANGTVTLRNGEGGLMGSSEAPLQYLQAQKSNLVEHNVEVFKEVKELVLECRVTGEMVDGSLSTFADDSARKIPCGRSEQMEDIKAKVDRVNQSYNKTSATMGVQAE